YGLPVMVDKGPFVLEYLERLRGVINSALADYPRVLAFRADLRIPNRLGLADDFNTNKVISRFFESFKAKIESDRHRARVAATYAHDTKVRYFWVREMSTGNVQHYHVLILLNMDAYYTVGRLGSDRVNMVRRLDEAWASALGHPFIAVGCDNYKAVPIFWLAAVTPELTKSGKVQWLVVTPVSVIR